MARGKQQQDVMTAPADGVEKSPVSGDILEGDGTGTPLPAMGGLDHPVARAFAHLVAAREELVRARADRGPDVEVVGDAGILAQALLLIGGALPDDAAPWGLAHALADMPGMADADGTDLFVRFTAFVTSALYATRRRKTLKLPAPGLERFAELATKHPTRKAVLEAIEAAKADDHATREAKNAVHIERQRSLNAAQAPDPRPAGPPIPDLSKDDDLRV